MSDEPKVPAPSEASVSAATGADRSDAEAPHEGERFPLLLGPELLRKNETGAESAGLDLNGSGPAGAGSRPEDASSRLGPLSRLFRRGRKGPVGEPPDSSDMADSALIGPEQDMTPRSGFGHETDQVPVSDEPPEPQIEPEDGPVQAVTEKDPRKGLFLRKRTKAALAPDGPGATAPESETPHHVGDGDQVPPGLPETPKRAYRSPKRGFPPIQVLIGWVGESARKDVLEHARGFAEDHIETLETAWIAMAEFRGGTIFEIHEGGSGQAYLPDLIEQLSRDPEQVLWVPSGTKLNRVVTLSLVDGRPFSMMLNEADSARVRGSGQEPIGRSGRMSRLSPRGTAVLAVGATLFAIALGGLSASAYLAASVNQQPLPALSYNPDNLPHGQIITLSNALRDDRWVSKIVFENGTWRADFETFDELTLPEDTGEAQRLIEEAVSREEILQRERDRKIEELGSQ